MHKEIRELELGITQVAFQSSILDLENFKQTVMWKDLCMMLKAQIVARRNELETTGRNMGGSGVNATMEDIAFIQGMISNAKDMFGLPDLIINMLKQNKEDDNDE